MTALVSSSLARCFFARAHSEGPWSRSSPQGQLESDETRPPAISGDSPISAATSTNGRRFPAKAFAEMCLGQPSAKLRLERRVVNCLVLGSDFCSESRTGDIADDSDVVHSSERGGSAGAWRGGLEASAEFHGANGWSFVDSTGHVEGSAGNKIPWHEFVYEWYDARF